mmetsp:Transcript_5678/g.25213  ORF Transcript_5678/g.25213 Transcript_5678/m.25213 type:complete len:258 (-) Transcript_5678:68-841(-)
MDARAPTRGTTWCSATRRARPRARCEGRRPCAGSSPATSRSGRRAPTMPPPRTPFGTRRRGATATATASSPRWTSTRPATRPRAAPRLARPRTAAGVPVATCPSPRFSGGSSPRLRGSSARTAARSCTRRVRFSSRRTSRCARGSTSASGMTSSRCLSRRTGRQRPTHSPRGTRTRTSWPRMTSRNWTGTRWTTGRFGRTGSRCDPTCTAATVSTSRGGFESRSPGGTRGAPTSWEEEMDDEAMVKWIEWNVPPYAR